MRFSLRTPGALRHAFDDVYLHGVQAEVSMHANEVGATLVAYVAQGRLTLRQYEQLAGYLLAERGEC